MTKLRVDEREYVKMLSVGKVKMPLQAEAVDEPQKAVPAPVAEISTAIVEAIKSRPEADFTLIVQAINGMRDALIAATKEKPLPAESEKKKGKWECTIIKDQFGKTQTILIEEK